MKHELDALRAIKLAAVKLTMAMRTPLIGEPLHAEFYDLTEALVKHGVSREELFQILGQVK